LYIACGSDQTTGYDIATDHIASHADYGSGQLTVASGSYKCCVATRRIGKHYGCGIGSDFGLANIQRISAQVQVSPLIG
jgi:hypothetical protein